MNYSETVDHMVFSEGVLLKYNGHCRLETFQLSQNGHPNATADMGTRRDVTDWTARQCAAWLKLPSSSDGAVAGTLKMLMVRTCNKRSATGVSAEMPGIQDQQIRSQHAAFVKDVFSQTQLPLVGFASYIKTLLTFACVPGRVGDDTALTEGTSRYYCSSPGWAATWSYNTATRSTAAVLFYREGDGDARAQDAISDLVRLQENIDHPMMLAYIKTKISVSQIFLLLDDMNTETRKLEQGTGMRTWDWSLEREIKRKGTPDPPNTTIERFNVLSGKVTNIRFRLRTLQEQIQFISRCNAKHRERVTADASAVQKCADLDNMTQLIAQYTAVHLFDADALAERLSNQMTSMFQLTAQKDSRIGIEIARDSRRSAVQSARDNKSLKTIAFITFFFLPGTFVASFFAMPLFRWDALAQDQIVSRRLWIYWAVAVPVTLMTALVWVLWFAWTRHEEARQDEKEQVDLEKSLGPRPEKRKRKRRAKQGVWGSVKMRIGAALGWVPGLWRGGRTIDGVDVESSRTNSCESGKVR